MINTTKQTMRIEKLKPPGSDEISITYYFEDSE